MKGFFASTIKEPQAEELHHGECVREIAGECVVLMRNDGLLPIKNTKKRIALYGNGARRTIHGGGGSGCVNARVTVTLEDAFRENGFRVESTAWMDRYDSLIAHEEEMYWERINKRAEELGVIPKMLTLTDHFRIPDQPLINREELPAAETSEAVFVISRRTREGEDLEALPGQYFLSRNEEENLRMLAEHFGRLTILLNTGTLALLDVLTGRCNPSGRLADTWAERYEDYPNAESFTAGGMYPNDVMYEEGLFIGYRYFDSYGVKAAFPFGYGLSYTSFVHKTENVTLENGIMSVSVVVKNTGSVSGREVVQLYCGYPEDGLPAPKKVLRAFAKTSQLAPGDSQTLVMSFSLRDMAVYKEEEACWLLQKGIYSVYIGTDVSEAGVVALIMVEADFFTERCRTLFADPEPVKERRPPHYFCEIPENVPLLCWDGSGIETIVHSYSEAAEELIDRYPQNKICFQDLLSGKNTAEELTAQLTEEELVWMCIGSIDTKVKDIVGSSSGLVPGAAGDTCHILEKTRGVPGCIMADGPAGLRLTPEFTDDDVTYYQFCTAVPIAASLAQSWNPEVTQRAGAIVGKEMQRFGVKLWLAPAMNLHRNPLCGRNFEYFSEDPYLSAAFAEGWVRSIQAFSGCGVVIKHFACNNQENNRLYVNEHISERTLRELYLKGFEQVIRGTDPMSVMTSYNLINGIHCASNRDLLVHLLRDEWEYKGMIMTDWFSTQNIKFMMGIGETRYSHTDPAECTQTGVSLQMPGNEALVQELKAAVAAGRLTKAQLQEAVLPLIRMLILLQS